MPQWEYKFVSLDAKKLHKDDEKLASMSSTVNQIGGQGWELVRVAPMNVTQGLDLGGSTKAFTFVFKRSVAIQAIGRNGLEVHPSGPVGPTANASREYAVCGLGRDAAGLGEWSA